MTVIIALANLIVGTLIGIAGIAGFLLPITLNGFLGLALPDALALSFISFLTSGIIGTWSYHRAGNMDFRLAAPLCVGSLLGALVGVKLNLLIPVVAGKLLLYTVVLASGISILLRKDNGADKNTSPIIKNRILMMLLGFVTAAICSLTGAGGPILVMPLLASLGIGLRTAVGVSLLDSVAIALPACFGYMAHVSMSGFGFLAALSVVFHGGGVLVGAKLAGKVNLKTLKLIVALLAISASCYMLITNIIQLL